MNYKSSRRLKQFLVVLATAGMILVNFLAGRGYINGTTPGDISDKYANLLTPAGYAFSIWGLIYLGMSAFVAYQALPAQADNPRLARIRTLYILSCTANVSWIYLWHYELIPLSLLAIFALLGSLILINRNLIETANGAEMWAARVPFNIYFGWVTAATILNFTIALLYLGFNADAATASVLGILLTAVTAFFALVVGREFHSLAYSLTIAWALIAIAVNQRNHRTIFFAAILGAAVAILSTFFGRRNGALKSANE